MSHEPSVELAGRILLALDVAKDPAANTSVDAAFQRAERCETAAQSFGVIVGSLALDIGRLEAHGRRATAAVVLDVLRLVCIERAIAELILDGWSELGLGDGDTPV